MNIDLLASKRFLGIVVAGLGLFGIGIHGVDNATVVDTASSLIGIFMTIYGWFHPTGTITTVAGLPIPGKKQEDSSTLENT